MTEAGCGDRHAPVPEPEFDDPPGRGRRPLTAHTAAGVLQLLADHFRSVRAGQRSNRNSARSWLMIRRQPAFYPRTADGGLHRRRPHTAPRRAVRPPAGSLEIRSWVIR